MKYQLIIQTFISRFLILGLNFGLVIYSTNMWGSEGKGLISIIIANLSIVSFISNIFSGSSTSYFASKFRREQIVLYAYSWSVFVGCTVPFIFSYSLTKEYTFYLIILSVISSLLSTNINLFIGMKNIKLFNIYTILQLLIQVLFIVGMVYVLGMKKVTVYFIAQIICLFVLFVSSSIQLWQKLTISHLYFSKNIRNDMFNYGWKTQLSSFFQFLNNRLSFYFLEYFRGITSVGVFSVGIAFSEAIWTVSRSLAYILYSDIINSDNPNHMIAQTKISLKLSFLMTLICIIVMLLIPASFYTMVFGKDFYETKKIILLLSPGILAIAVSNIIGFYFAGMNRLKILNIKSIVGLVFTLLVSFYLIPRWGIIGACIMTSISYCLSSALLLWSFYQFTEFHFYDFWITKNEIRLILQKLKK
ncbi:teichoic acid transporter [Chryseobacterium nematophagum]|uniref:Teichoic acid transporter n=1 Tax=Chryseobacterium nematophagum TaxID=2305228 RepID=A0A3M7LGE3_9FLAO|nr:polysaccharide biosynthesis C-terminal domain-containing protein [Chryseobacterium nematophagum]RMZ60602.1 teichoic acid transporter [Chryseobacterium nematophagum]